MKIAFLLLAGIFGIITTVHAQNRNCGTNNYYEMRKNQDPEVAKRMEENEKQMQEWIKQQPQQINASNETSKIIFPEIEGFTQTGNVEADRVSYAKAKQKLALTAGPKKELTEEEIKILREKKKAENTLIAK